MKTWGKYISLRAWKPLQVVVCLILLLSIVPAIEKSHLDSHSAKSCAICAISLNPASATSSTLYSIEIRPVTGAVHYYVSTYLSGLPSEVRTRGPPELS